MTGGRRSTPRVLLMVVVLLWSGALGAGFAVVAATSSTSLGPGRTLLFVVLAVPLLLVAAQTLRELLRHPSAYDQV